jgi:hypothetical protein
VREQLHEPADAEHGRGGKDSTHATSLQTTADVVSPALDDGRSSLDFGLLSLAETTSAAALWATALDVSGAGDRTRTGDVQLGKETGRRTHGRLYDGTRREDVQNTPAQNGGSVLENGLGGRSVDPGIT